LVKLDKDQSNKVEPQVKKLVRVHMCGVSSSLYTDESKFLLQKKLLAASKSSRIRKKN